MYLNLYIAYVSFQTIYRTIYNNVTKNTLKLYMETYTYTCDVYIVGQVLLNKTLGTDSNAYQNVCPLYI